MQRVRPARQSDRVGIEILDDFGRAGKMGLQIGIGAGMSGLCIHMNAKMGQQQPFHTDGLRHPRRVCRRRRHYDWFDDWLGDWLGDHGLILKGPMHYEGLLKVPMIVKGPGVPAGKRVTEPVSTLDLGATFADYTESAPLLDQHGQSLRPLIEGDAKRAFALNEWELLPTRAGVALSLRTVRTKTHKMTVDLQSGAGELYNLTEDPNELNNLFHDPACRAIREDLEAAIASRPDDAGHMHAQVGLA